MSESVCCLTLLINDLNYNDVDEAQGLLNVVVVCVLSEQWVIKHCFIKAVMT